MAGKVVKCFQLELLIIITTVIILLLLLLLLLLFFFFQDLNYFTIYFKKCNRSLRPDSTVGEKGKKRGETEKIISGRSEPSGGLPLRSLRSPIFFFLMRRLFPGWCNRSTAEDEQIRLSKYIAEKNN